MTERHDDDYKTEVSRYIRDKGREGVTVTEADLGPMLADDPKLEELVRKLVVDKPNWRFEVCNFFRDFNNDCIRYRSVVIKNQNGSKLGSVGVGTRSGVEVLSPRCTYIMTVSKKSASAPENLALRMSKPPYVQSISSSTIRLLRRL
jgi:hypothetical protein